MCMCVLWEPKACNSFCWKRCSHSSRWYLFRASTCAAVPVTVCRPRSVLVQAQAVGRDRRRAVVAQRGRAAGPAVHVLHVHAAVTAGQVVLTHPVGNGGKRTHTARIYLFMSVSVRGAQTGEGPCKIYQGLTIPAHSGRDVT